MSDDVALIAAIMFLTEEHGLKANTMTRTEIIANVNERFPGGFDQFVKVGKIDS